MVMLDPNFQVRYLGDTCEVTCALTYQSILFSSFLSEVYLVFRKSAKMFFTVDESFCIPTPVQKSKFSAFSQDLFAVCADVHPPVCAWKESEDKAKHSLCVHTFFLVGTRASGG